MPELKAVSPIDDPSPLALLKDVRDVMIAPDAVQSRLDKLVALIAARLDSEVCSIYLMQPGQMLELFATAGLNRNAIHHTRLAIGQGLVGEIASRAKPLNLAEAQNHPKFVYRPETGEEAFHSFVGVPIITHHQVIGVLVVQSETPRIYSEMQVEVLQTVAMVLAELAAGQNLVDQYALAREKRTTSLTHSFKGESVCDGLAKAPAVLHRPHITIRELVSDHPAAEEQRLREAVAAMQRSVDTLIASSGELEDDHADILETYRMFAHDEGWMRQIIHAINSGLTAEAAVKQVVEDLNIKLEQAQNPHVKRRIEDLEDLTTRLLYHLSGTSYTAAHSELPKQFVLFARSLGPAELLEYGQNRVSGLVLEKGSGASHIAIIARMLDIPVVAGVPGAADIVQTGDTVVVDGTNGEVTIRPSEEVEQEVDSYLERIQRQHKMFAAMRHEPSSTLDGTRVDLKLNIGLHIDVQELAAKDVAGIGLFRTELPYLTASTFPTVKEQKRMYRAVLQQAKEKPVIFRTFDMGGDKPVPYLHIPEEDNPAMGWRATRIGLDRPALLRQQFKALLLAAEGRELHLMLPMISTVQEVKAARMLLDLECERIAPKRRPGTIRLGVMLEIPSLIFELDELLKEIDFLSIGSNDLLQFMFARDRANSELGSQPALRANVLCLFRDIVKKADAAGVDIGFCGDIASKPLEAMALLGCGLRQLSLPPKAIGPVKAMIRSLCLHEFTKYLEYLCQNNTGDLRGYIQAYANDHNIHIK
jgi:phosphotransferase system enzyme I (PtsP)